MTNPAETVVRTPTERVADAIIQYGSVYYGIKNGWVTAQDILNRLTHLTVSDEALVAYYQVCKKIDPVDQRVGDEHFLTLVNDPGYFAVYVFSKGQVPFPGPTSEKSVAQINSNLAISLHKLHDDVDFKAKMYAICNKFESIQLSQITDNLLPLIVKSQSTTFSPYVATLKPKKQAKAFFAADELQIIAKLKLKNKLSLALKRALLLKERATRYWELFQLELYEKFVTDLINKGDVGKLSDVALELLPNVFPGVFGQKFEIYNDVARKIFLLPSVVRHYVLGLPITEGDLKEQVDQALIYLSAHGENEYVDLINEHQTGFCSQEYPFTRPKENVRNTEDVLGESIFSYSPFDIISYRSSNNRYFFVRREFENLLKTKKNHWTQEELPQGVLAEIEKREEMAKLLNLPPSGTISDFLTRIENDTLYQSEFKEEKDADDDDRHDDAENDLQGSDMPEMVRQMFRAFGMGNGFEEMPDPAGRPRLYSGLFRF